MDDKQEVTMDTQFAGKLDLNAPLLSVRRPNGVNTAHISCDNTKHNPQYSYNRIPFCWEETPGKPKDMEASGYNSNADVQWLPPKLPPGRWHPPKVSNCEEVRDDHDDGCDGDVEDDFFSDAMDMFSLSEQIDTLQKVEKVNASSHGSIDFDMEASGASNGTQFPSFIIQRFLADAKALAAASSAAMVKKDANNNKLSHLSEKCVLGTLKHSYSSPKGCGLYNFFPWRMRMNQKQNYKPCGMNSPARAIAMPIKMKAGGSPRHMRNHPSLVESPRI